MDYFIKNAQRGIHVYVYVVWKIALVYPVDAEVELVNSVHTRGVLLHNVCTERMQAYSMWMRFILCGYVLRFIVCQWTDVLVYFLGTRILFVYASRMRCTDSLSAEWVFISYLSVDWKIVLYYLILSGWKTLLVNILWSEKWLLTEYGCLRNCRN